MKTVRESFREPVTSINSHDIERFDRNHRIELVHDLDYVAIHPLLHHIFFKNKDEIFINCAERLFFDLYEDVWQEIKDEPNMLLRLRKRAWSFLVTYPRWADAMNLLRGASVSPNQAFGEKYRQIIFRIISPLVRELEKGAAQGIIRPVNPVIAAHLLLGVVDYCGHLHQLGRYNEIELFNAINGFLLRGIQRRESVKD